MPACITHNQFAQDVLTQLSSPAADLCAFFWGAQGPDFLFCHRYFQVSARKGQRSLQEYGSALHKTPPSQTLSAMRNFLAHHSNPTYRSYILGFICHYALDSTAHPYINARAVQLAAQRPNENTSTMHGEIESALDAIVLRWKTGALPSQVRLKDLFPKNEGVQRQIACLYRELLFAVYRQDVPEQSLYQATNDAHFLFACSTAWSREGPTMLLLIWFRLPKTRKWITPTLSTKNGAGRTLPAARIFSSCMNMPWHWP